MQSFPCEPNAAFGQAAPLLTECAAPTADVLNALLFTHGFETFFIINTEINDNSAFV